MNGYYNIFKTSLGYISLSEMRDEYFLTYAEYEALGNAKKGDKVKVGDEDIVCMGTFAELLKENEQLKRENKQLKRDVRDARGLWFCKAREASELQEKVKKLSEALKTLLTSAGLPGIDIIDSKTGEVLS